MKSPTDLKGDLRRFNLLLLCLAVIGSISPTVFAQAQPPAAADSYVLVGRVVDSKGVPFSDADIHLEPVKYDSKSFERFIEGIGTDTDGRFKFVYNRGKAARAGTFMLFVSLDNEADALTPITAPFDRLRPFSHKFDGQSVTFGKESRIDVGDIAVRFWFGTAKLKFSKPMPWKDVYLTVQDGAGHPVYSSSISQEEVEKFVKDNGSSLKISLPEGSWKVELHNWNGKKIFAKSPRFEIKKKQSLNISMLD